METITIGDKTIIIMNDNSGEMGANSSTTLNEFREQPDGKETYWGYTHQG